MEEENKLHPNRPKHRRNITSTDLSNIIETINKSVDTRRKTNFSNNGLIPTTERHQSLNVLDIPKIPNKESSPFCPKDRHQKNILNNKQGHWFQLANEDLNKDINILKKNTEIITELYSRGKQLLTLKGIVLKREEHKSSKIKNMKMCIEDIHKTNNLTMENQNHSLNGTQTYTLLVSSLQLSTHAKILINNDRTFELFSRKFFINPNTQIASCVDNRSCKIKLTTGIKGPFNKFTGSIQLFSTDLLNPRSKQLVNKENTELIGSCPVYGTIYLNCLTKKPLLKFKHERDLMKLVSEIPPKYPLKKANSVHDLNSLVSSKSKKSFFIKRK